MLAYTAPCMALPEESFFFFFKESDKKSAGCKIRKKKKSSHAESLRLVWMPLASLPHSEEVTIPAEASFPCVEPSAPQVTAAFCRRPKTRTLGLIGNLKPCRRCGWLFVSVCGRGEPLGPGAGTSATPPPSARTWRENGQ